MPIMKQYQVSDKKLKMCMRRINEYLALVAISNDALLDISSTIREIIYSSLEESAPETGCYTQNVLNQHDRAAAEQQDAAAASSREQDDDNDDD